MNYDLKYNFEHFEKYRKNAGAKTNVSLPGKILMAPSPGEFALL